MILPYEPEYQNIRPEAEGFIQSALDTLPAHIAILDESGVIIGANAAWRQLSRDCTTPLPNFGLGMDYLVACERCAELDLPPADRVAGGIRELVEGYRELLEVEYSRDNRHFYVLRARRFSWHFEQRLIVSHENVTTLERLRRNLRQQENKARTVQQKLLEERLLREQQDRCLSMMSHELRTPLASIHLSHDMLAHYSEQSTAEERQQYLDNIRLQVKQLDEILGDVASLSRAERSESAFNPAAHDMITYCRDIVETFQISHHRTHRISFDCSDAAISAEFDGKLLRRALTNLIGNAIKYSPWGGEIQLRLWLEGDLVHITVSDEGIGIPAEDADALFLAFRRASNVGSLTGSGLGLAIAKQAVDLHDGVIYFHSEVGVGTTFEITLPQRSRRALSSSPKQAML